MSPPSPPAAGNPMRQQLDELDALLQRMLALPINQLDEESPAPEPPPPHRPAEPAAEADAPVAPPPPPAPPPAPPRANGGWKPPAMVLLADSSPVQPPDEPPPSFEQSWAINLNPQQGSSILGSRSPAAGALRPPGPEAAPARPPVWRAETVTYAHPAGEAPVVPPPRPQVPPTAPEPRPAPAQSAIDFRPAEPAPLVLLPIVWLNRAFDRTALGFGPPGRWLRSPGGRNLLGASGLLMLAGSVAWGVLDWIGWTW